MWLMARGNLDILMWMINLIRFPFVIVLYNIFPFYDLLQVTQLTGFTDPVYAEAYVHINQYYIVLDVLTVNHTSDTLQNLTLKLATLGRFDTSTVFLNNPKSTKYNLYHKFREINCLAFPTIMAEELGITFKY